MVATCMGGRATPDTSEYLRQVVKICVLPFTLNGFFFFSKNQSRVIKKLNNSKRHPLYPVPDASPLTVSITVSHEQNNTIILSWEPPPRDTHNGIIQGYKVIRKECKVSSDAL